MTDPIRLVPDAAEGGDEAPVSPLPMFEGRTVDSCVMRISGATPLAEVEDMLVSVDDRLRLIGEYKVVSIRHFVDPKTGDLVREQLLKPTLATPAPWNPDDPDDDGVIRAVQA